MYQIWARMAVKARAKHLLYFSIKNLRRIVTRQSKFLSPQNPKMYFLTHQIRLRVLTRNLSCRLNCVSKVFSCLSHRFLKLCLTLPTLLCHRRGEFWCWVFPCPDSVWFVWDRYSSCPTACFSAHSLSTSFPCLLGQSLNVSSEFQMLKAVSDKHIDW